MAFRGSRCKHLVVALMACCIGSALSAPSALGWEYVVGPPRTETVSWGLGPFGPTAPPSGPSSLWISVGTGYCVGEEPPFIHHVDVVEKPHRSTITVYLRFPAPVEVSGPVEPGEPVPACADVGLGMSKRIKLDLPKAGRNFFDDSSSPPRRVHWFPR